MPISPPPAVRFLLGIALLSSLSGTALIGCRRGSDSATGSTSQVVDVPSQPAFRQLPGEAEQPAAVGQSLPPRTRLRTEKPGRIQVRLSDGRQLRLGGDALLELGPEELKLERGQVIGWINPGRGDGLPLRLRTRVATASISGTTVFIDDSPERVLFLSWEGPVRVVTDRGRSFLLSSGEVVAGTEARWQEPRRLSAAELATRRRRSLLLNGFEAPMETLPVLERELGLKGTESRP